MYIDLEGDRYIGVCEYSQREIFKAVGFEWDPKAKYWWTARVDVALAVQGISWTDAAADYGQAFIDQRDSSLDASWRDDTEFQPPKPEGIDPDTGKPFEYIPYQRAGVEYAVARDDTLISDQPGLGKSVQGVGVANCMAIDLSRPLRVLIICPASLKENWRREFTKWHTGTAVAGIAEAQFEELVQVGTYKNGKAKFKKQYTPDYWPDTDVVILNYDILERFSLQIHAVDWDLLICDECHALKTVGTKRTLMVLGGDDRFKGQKIVYRPIAATKRVFLSGTPMMNRPKELWPLCEAFDPKGLGRDLKSFQFRYCAAQFTQFGLDDRGASNQVEMGEKLRQAFMIRRLKRDVLPHLPPKRRNVVLLDSVEIRELVNREDEIAKQLKLYEMLLNDRDLLNIREADGEDNFDSKLLDMDYAKAVSGLDGPLIAVLFEELSAVRRELGIAKIPAVTEWVTNFLEGGDKLVLYAYHATVVETLFERLHNWKPALIYGKTPPRKRQAQVDMFQNDESCRLNIVNIDSGGVGYTMTAAHDVAGAEYDWVPTKIEQMEDRICRIGQKADQLDSWFLVANRSMDANMAQKNRWKEETIKIAMG